TGTFPRTSRSLNRSSRIDDGAASIMSAFRRPCIVCGKPSTGTRCALHQRLLDRERAIGYESSALKPGGGSRRWRKQRERCLRRDDYVCARCGGIASEVDHIRPRV